jgi:hypothetical protein
MISTNATLFVVDDDAAMRDSGSFSGPGHILLMQEVLD